MRLIRNIIITKVEEDFLLINSLNGLMDIIDLDTLNLIDRWYPLDNIMVSNEKESKLYTILESRGYLCNTETEELEKKEELICSLRNRQSQLKAKSNKLTLVMTYDCNFRCPYCFEGMNSKFKNSYMNKELIDAALSLIGDSLEYICLFGGEPLLLRNREAIEYLISKTPDKIYSTITNGYNLDSFIDLFEKINVSYIMITLDGAQSTHDRRRFLANGEGTFDKIMHNIQIALEKGIPIKIRMNVDNDNFSECIKLREIMIESFKKYIDILSFEISPIMEMEPLNRTNMFTDLYMEDVKNINILKKLWT